MAGQQKPITLSPTKVDTFYNCQRLFYYTYINQPCVPPQKKWFLIGNIAHKALEHFHAAKDQFPWSKVMGDCFRRSVLSHNAFAHLKSGLLEKSDLYDIKAMLGGYVHYLRSSGDAVNIVSLEKLERLQLGDVTVWLKADRIDMPYLGKYRVIDYKTSAEPPSKKDQLASVQIPSYGLLIRTKYAKDAAVDGVYMYLRHMRSKKGVSALTITEEMMEEARKKYIDVYNKVTNGCAYRPNFSYKYCKWCDYKLYCMQNHGLKKEA